MKEIIGIFKDIIRNYQNRKNGFQYISEDEFNRKVDRTKPIIIIS